MEVAVNNFVINFATVNGSGSQTANYILLKTIFRMGIPVGAKNFFPSNIQGMPSWFQIRLNNKGFTGFCSEIDILVNLNSKTLLQDARKLKPQSIVICDQEMLSESLKSENLIIYPIPYKEITQKLNIEIKYKKFSLNMIYVGFLCEMLNLDKIVLDQVIRDHFGDKESALNINLVATEAGAKFYRDQYIDRSKKFICTRVPSGKNKILMEGNTAAGMGLLYGGCHFVSWYPITPSTSVVESFKDFVQKSSQDKPSRQIILQAEDELAAICMVLGAGWAGARALTATSGPGLSLMAEAAGFAYYAEIPSVIWNVQRAGPSTGLPTRTAQGDLLFAHFLSHGDARHVCLLPGNLKESFEFAQTCFDLAETLQTLVIVLSDLDLGMNYWVDEEWEYPKKSFQRGRVVTEDDLNAGIEYERYNDVEGDGIPARTLPGNRHEKASYFTRGSGHDIKANYTENPELYREVLERLSRKWETAKKLVPGPITYINNNSIGVVYTGPLDSVLDEALDTLKEKGVGFDYCRVRALPLHREVEIFLETHDVLYIVDQNQSSQLKAFLSIEFPIYASKLLSIRNFDGQPVSASILVNAILKDLNVRIMSN